jgi:hypothetical protein
VTKDIWSLRRASDKRERAAYLRRVAEMISLHRDRQQLLSDAEALESEADRIDGRAAEMP